MLLANDTYELNGARLAIGKHTIQVEDNAHEAHAETMYTINN
jgi:hypothetical protein